MKEQTRYLTGLNTAQSPSVCKLAHSTPCSHCRATRSGVSYKELNATNTCHALNLRESISVIQTLLRKCIQFSSGSGPFVGSGLVFKSSTFYSYKVTSYSAPECAIFEHEMASQLCTYIKCLHDCTATLGLSTGKQAQREPVPTLYNTVVSQTQPVKWVTCWRNKYESYLHIYTLYHTWKEREKT